MPETEQAPVPEYQPAAGVKSDFEKLLTKFSETESVRFEAFNQLWKEWKLPLIFSGRQTDRECREVRTLGELLPWLQPAWLRDQSDEDDPSQCC